MISELELFMKKNKRFFDYGVRLSELSSAEKDLLILELSEILEDDD